ncbi:MAG: hypothetical protein HXO02_02930 [Prevotella salivae]|jgi:hypothetical protein|nr:hypothetical protein [Segatella salivae]
MKKFNKKIMAIALICAISCTTGFVVKEKQSREAQAWVGIGYLATKKGASPEAGAAIGVIGVVQGGIHSAAWGMAFGGPAGFIAGAVVGL